MKLSRTTLNYVIAFILNLITPSADERTIWTPMAFLRLTSSSIVSSTNFGTTTIRGV